MPSTSTLRRWWGPACRGPHTRVDLYGAGTVVVKSSIVPAVKALDAGLAKHKYVTRYHDTGAYNCRRITGGSGYSLHAYGIALDINWQSNPYSYRLITNMPSAMRADIKAIRTNNGRQVWYWGGDWSGTKDAMHWEIGCSPADIRTGINSATIPRVGTITIVTPSASTAIPKEDDMFTYEYRPAGSPTVVFVMVNNGKQLALSGNDMLTERRKSLDHLIVSQDEFALFKRVYGAIQT